MAGKLTAVFAVGASANLPLSGGSALTTSTLAKLVSVLALNSGGTLSIATMLALYARPAALSGDGSLTRTFSQIYPLTSDLAGGGELLTAISPVLVPELPGEGTLTAAIKEIQKPATDLVSEGVLSAAILPTTQLIWRSDENVAASSQSRPSVFLAGVYVTLIGGGGGGRNGGSGASDLNKTGGGGGGGGAKVGKSFIPAASLGATYSVTRGAGSANGPLPSNATASTFTSGSITLTANGGGGGAGAGVVAAGGVASQSGISGMTLANGGAGGMANTGATGTTAPVTTNGAGAGGGGGGGVTNTNAARAGGGGGDTIVTTGNDGGTTSGTSGGSPTTVTAGMGGQGGGGGGGNQTTGTRAGGNGAAYGGGGGGGGAGASSGNGGDGGIGYTLLEWAAQMLLPTMAGEGTLSATAVINKLHLADDFNRANSTTSAGPGWTNRRQVIGVKSNDAYPVVGASTYAMASYATVLGTDDMEVSVVIGTPEGSGSAAQVGVLLGANTAGQCAFATWTAGSNLINLRRISTWTGSVTDMDNQTQTLNVGDVFTLRRVGNVYTTWVNGVRSFAPPWTDSGNLIPRDANHRIVGVVFASGTSTSVPHGASWSADEL